MYECCILGVFKNLPSYTSVTDAMTFIMIRPSIYNGLFCGGITVIVVFLMDFGMRKKYLHALLRSSDSEM